MTLKRFRRLKALGITLILSIQQTAATTPIHARIAQRLQQQTTPECPSYNFSVPIDHFHNETKYEPHSSDFYNLRYYVDDTYFTPGGPVILIGCGEVSCTPRLPYMNQGIGKILAEATGGLTVLLEHRYYGTSYPVPDLSTENMRFLDTEQALADTAYFVRNIQYPGLEQYNLTSYETPYILYGGSYAGAFVALARKIYPDDFWGAISGSGVPQVIDDYWQYLEAFRVFGDKDCVEATQKITRVVDNVLLGGEKETVKVLKGFFGLEDKDDVDFAFTVTQGPLGLQETMWDPDEDRPDLARYCLAVTTEKALFSNTRTLYDDVKRILAAGGSKNETDELLPRFLNWIGNIRSNIIKKDDNINFLSKGPENISIPQGMERAWTYQTCTQWGYFVTGSGVPTTQLPLISRLIDYNFASKGCADWFGIPAAPDMDSINRYGGFNFSHSRVAFVDGSDDPWRQAGVHALGYNEKRESTDEEPFILIEGAVHHWDEYGPKEGATGSWLPPKAVKEAQKEEIRFVKVWLEEWHKVRGTGVNKEDEADEL